MQLFFGSILACKSENPFEFRVRIRLRLYWGLQPIVLAVQNGPVLDAQSELDVQTGIFCVWCLLPTRK